LLYSILIGPDIADIREENDDMFLILSYLIMILLMTSKKKIKTMIKILVMFTTIMTVIIIGTILFKKIWIH